ncbi:hypothetical protein N9822_00695, partial [bacterium]|nr:hypothetical protein [bacterium]
MHFKFGFNSEDKLSFSQNYGVAFSTVKYETETEDERCKKWQNIWCAPAIMTAASKAWCPIRQI